MSCPPDFPWKKAETRVHANSYKGRDWNAGLLVLNHSHFINDWLANQHLSQFPKSGHLLLFSCSKSHLYWNLPILSGSDWIVNTEALLEGEKCGRSYQQEFVLSLTIKFGDEHVTPSLASHNTFQALSNCCMCWDGGPVMKSGSFLPYEGCITWVTNKLL